MEPLPATQDALRLELRSARSLEVRHLLFPSSVLPLHGAARGTTVDSRVPPRRLHRHRRLSTVFIYIFDLPNGSRGAGTP